MSPENAALAKRGTRRPIGDQIVLHLPFLADVVFARLARLPPGSSLRQRLLPWGLRRAFEAISREDFAVPLLAYEPDVEIFVSGFTGLGVPDRHTGHQGWRDFVSATRESFVDTRVRLKRMLDGGDRSAAEGETQGQGMASGADVGANWSTVYYLSPRGKIRRQDFFVGPDGWKHALEAAGLSE